MTGAIVALIAIVAWMLALLRVLLRIINKFDEIATADKSDIRIRLTNDSPVIFRISATNPRTIEIQNDRQNSEYRCTSFESRSDT